MMVRSLYLIVRLSHRGLVGGILSQNIATHHHRHLGYPLFSNPSMGISVNWQQVAFINSFFHFKKRKNYYEILNVPRDANKKQVKKSYFELAKLYHPDSAAAQKDSKSQEKFQEIQEAYAVLGDDEKRAQYDAEVIKDLGTEYKKKETPVDFTFMKRTVEMDKAFKSVFGEMDNFFHQKDDSFANTEYAETIWGHAPAQSLIISLTMEQAASGCKQEFQIRTIDLCYMCDGTKAAYGYRGSTCPFCDENGMETVPGVSVACKIKCRVCQGTRHYIKHLCPDCEGTGYQVQMKVVNFNIPPGIRDGEVLKLVIREQIIYVTCRIKPHDYFQLIGDDIHTTNEISISQAVLGGKTRVKGLYSDHEVSIPPGIQSHDKIKLPNEGWLREDSSFGDHFVECKVKAPVKLSRHQRKIWQTYAELEEDTPTGTIDGILATAEGNKYVEKDEKIGLFTRIKRALLG